MDNKRVARELIVIARQLSALDVEQYKSLNDASKYEDGLRKGMTEIWYAKPSPTNGVHYDRLKSKGMLPDPRNLKKTHVLIGKIKERNLEKIYDMMQGENWSPNGEAYDLISKTDTHTSMSVGDIIVVGNKVVFVDGIGFKELKS